jgi:hypothetical protein
MFREQQDQGMVRGKGFWWFTAEQIWGTKIDWLVWPVKCLILYIIRYKYMCKYT